MEHTNSMSHPPPKHCQCWISKLALKLLQVLLCLCGLNVGLVLASKIEQARVPVFFSNFNILPGLKDVDASSDKLSIHAQVTNGQNPVMNADVW